LWSWVPMVPGTNTKTFMVLFLLEPGRVTAAEV
jgi:hypothetical protein